MALIKKYMFFFTLLNDDTLCDSKIFNLLCLVVLIILAPVLNKFYLES